MIFEPLPLSGAWRIRLEPAGDARGHFSRTFCAEEFRARGISDNVVQCGESFNRRRGTIRGLHWQDPPAAESKLIRCVAGCIFDVLVDVRPHSPTFGQWYGGELSPAAGVMHFAPEGIAHGVQTLEDGSVVAYQLSAPYHADLARGVRWDDPAIGITWPIQDDVMISERDRSLPLLRDIERPTTDRNLV